jgi:hypothetical protein
MPPWRNSGKFTFVGESMLDSEDDEDEDDDEDVKI